MLDDAPALGCKGTYVVIACTERVCSAAIFPNSGSASGGRITRPTTAPSFVTIPGRGAATDAAGIDVLTCTGGGGAGGCGRARLIHSSSSSVLLISEESILQMCGCVQLGLPMNWSNSLNGCSMNLYCAQFPTSFTVLHRTRASIVFPVRRTTAPGRLLAPPSLMNSMTMISLSTTIAVGRSAICEMRECVREEMKNMQNKNKNKNKRGGERTTKWNEVFYS